MSPRNAARCPGARPTRIRAVLAVTTVLAAVAVQSVVVVEAQAAAPFVTSLTSEGFTGPATADSGWNRPSSGTNGACLTAGSSSTQTPIPGCSSTAPDASGAGTLRLTTNVKNAVGTVYSTTSLPTSQGLDVRFTTYQWNSHTNPGADGINFILAATDPTNPAPPTTTGPLGGALGYSTNRSASGVTNGYLGFGIDVYGNYRSSSYGGSGCPGSTTSPQNVTVRGPGNGTAGYCIAGTTQVASGALDAVTATSRPAGVPVEVALNPAGTATTSLGGVSVPANSWLIAFTPLGGSQQTLTGALPTASQLATYGYPSSYYDPSSGLPYQLTFGWAASTGGSDEVHEINTLASSTLNGQLPDFNLALDDDQADALLAGSTATVSVTPSLDASQGPESRPATVTTTFPSGLTPVNPTGTDYACSTAARVVSCTYTPASTLQPGQALPTLAIPVQVGSTAVTGKTITAKVSSTDANPAQASRAVSVVAFTAQATPDHVTYGTAATLSAAGLPAAATGTITFASGGSTLCTATLPSTSCSTSSTLTPTSYAVTATYSGDARYATQTAGTPLVVTRSTPGLSAAVSADPVPYGTATVLLFSGLPADATGRVSFTAGGATLCEVADVRTASSCSTPTELDVGTYAVTATYGGDADYASTTARTTFSVAKVEVDLQASASPDPVPYGTADTLSVGGLAPGASGTVRFTTADGTTLCTIDDVTTGSSCRAPADLDLGTYEVTATYSGDAHHLEDQTITGFTVAVADTALVASVSDPSVPYGSSSTLSFSGLPPAATGTVTFTTDGRTLCTVDVESASSCASPTDLERGEHAVTATYSGDRRHHPSSGRTDLTVTALGSANFAASASDPTPSYGTADTLSFSGLAPGATGSVTFAAGGDTLCTVDDVTTGSSCTTAADLPAGAYEVEAAYSGDDNHASATASATFTVQKAATALVAGVTADHVTYGFAQTLSFTGLPERATGSVTFTAGSGAELCTVPDVTEATSCSTSTRLRSGSYEVTAHYSGDDNHEGSDSSTSFTLDRAVVELSAGPDGDGVPYGTAQTFSVGGIPAGATGSVAFRTGELVWCTVEDVTVATSCSGPADLPAGTYEVTVSYSGDDDHAPVQTALTLRVPRAGTSISASVGQETLPYGSAETLAFGGLPHAATGSVTFTSEGVELCTVADVTASTSCVADVALEPGRHDVVATYSGAASFDGSLDATTFTVVRAVVSLSAAAVTAAVPYGVGDTLTFSGLPPEAVGSVIFTSANRTLCTVEDVSAASSCRTVDDLAVGVYPVLASYSGDGRYASGTGSTGFSVTPGSTSLAVGVVASAVEHGERATLTVSGLPGGATGTVAFSSGDRLLCTVDIFDTDRCRTAADLPVGSYPVQAVYSGDASYASSTAATSFDVVPSTVTGFTASVDPIRATYGVPAVFSYGGLPADATGTVRFTVDAVRPRVAARAVALDVGVGDLLCEAIVGSSTTCLSPAFLVPGDYPVLATYSGDTNFEPTTARLQLAVQKASADLELGHSGMAVAGSPVTLTVSGVPDGATGTVELSEGGTLLCTVRLPARSCTTTALGAGSHTVDAVYSGDGNVDGSTTSFTLDVASAPSGEDGGSGGSDDGSSSDSSSRSGGSLASTGGPGPVVPAAALLLLVAGTGMVLVSRRRRR